MMANVDISHFIINLTPIWRPFCSKTFGGVGGYDNRVQDIVIDSNDFIITVGGITGNTDFSTVGGDTIDFSDLEHNWVLKIKSATGVID